MFVCGVFSVHKFVSSVVSKPLLTPDGRTSIRQLKMESYCVDYSGGLVTTLSIPSVDLDPCPLGVWGPRTPLLGTRP